MQPDERHRRAADTGIPNCQRAYTAENNFEEQAVLMENLPWIVGLFGLGLFIIAGLLTIRKRTSIESGGEGTAKEVKRFLGQFGPPVALSTLGFGMVWGIVVALWGLMAGLGFSVICTVGALSTLLLGGFGGQWVGPGAHEMKRRDEESAIRMLPGAIVWIVISGTLLAFFSFDGWLPWPER